MINIVNVHGSSNDKSSKYGYETWLDYWSELKGIDSNYFNICPNCLNIIDDNNKIVGAHVYICEVNEEENKYSVYTKIYIAPICNSCNISKQGYKVNSINKLKKDDIMQINKKYLVQHPKYVKKKR